MSAVLANEGELYFERGGPAYRLTLRLFEKRGVKVTTVRRIAGFLLITWVPLLAFALIEGRALGSTPRQSILLDFGTYARFFLAVPLLIVAESIVGPRLTGAALWFVEGGFVQEEDYPAIDRAIARIARWRESRWAELFILILAMTGAWTLTTESLYGTSAATWRSAANASGAGLGVSLTGLWYHIVAVPILQFFLYRWLWRLFVWSSFLWTVSRLKLEPVATHADRAGGLGFLGNAHLSLGVFALALTSVLSAEVASLIVFEKADLVTFRAPALIVLLGVELILLGPLVVFFPVMLRTRLAWARSYGLLVARYNRKFHEKWIEGKVPVDEPLLGSADIQSLADLGSSFEHVQAMNLFPCSLRVVVQLAVLTSLPCLPLVLFVIPIGRILEVVVGALL